MAQVSDAAIRVEATFFLGNAHYGPEAMIAEENDFEIAVEAEEAVKGRGSIQSVTALFLERKFPVFHANFRNHDGP